MGRKRKTLGKGIYEDASGRFIRISVKGEPIDLRREKDTNTPAGAIQRGRSYKDREVSWLRQERIRRQAAATLSAEVTAAIQARFSADIPRFLDTISSPGHRVNSHGYMTHWKEHFADRQRNEITDIDVQTAFAAIKKEPSTKIHIRRALIQFYDALNGKSGYNPGRSLRKPPKAEEEIRDLPWSLIEQIFEALPPGRAKARLMLIAYIGLPQKQIAALTPSDLRLESRELVVHPRRKGAGVAGVTLPLSDVAIAALEEFARVDAFGTFQNMQLVRTFKHGAKLAGVTLPADARPYDLRHSFLTELARGGADIRDIATLGMHATLEQAARYIKGAGSARATKTITAIPRFSTTTKPAKTPKGSTSLRQAGRKKAVTPPRKRPRKR